MTRICPQCNTEIDAAAKLCPVCLFGEGLKSNTVACTKCQSELDDDARFCPQCGAMARGSPAVPGDAIRTALAAKLASQYRIVRLLGQGGMGSVYLARDLTLEREVAIKVIKTSDDSREIYDRFRREAKTAARLSHPNIVPLHAFGEVEGMPYFVMGYVRGESLADRLRREGRLPEDEARRIFAEIAGALDHAHRQGIVHRDIKPDNVLLEDESGRALLTDFGVAKAVDKEGTLTQLGSVVGTPHYMSPEQASGRLDIDGRSDIYSLGVMAYAMLAGRLPFEGKNPANILTKHLTQAPAPIRSLVPTISNSTVQTIERCLAKNPAARWPDARSLKLALGAVEESQLPDDLQAVEGRGLEGVGIALVLLAFLTLLKAPALAILVNGGVLLTIYVGVILRLHRQGFSPAQSQRVIWTEPSWWPFWYPRPLRRRGNVWDRLPAVVRHARWWPVAFVLYVGLLFSGTFPSFFRSPEVFVLKFAVGLTIMVSTLILVRVRARRELSRRGLGGADIGRVMVSVPPSRAGFWRRPHIAAILAPSLGATVLRAESPHDNLQSILRDAEELSGPLRHLGAQAAVAGRQLVASIDHADREIADLARNLEPGEEQRLADKIEALAAPVTAGDELASMRALIEQQLVLIRTLSARIEEAQERRNRRVEMLRALALHVASLRARLTETPSELRHISDNVRTLCDDIGRQAMTIDPGVATEERSETVATVKP